MADHLPTPTPSPPPDATHPSISAQINAVTRKQHTELNRLIIDRLPLALPPNASDPALLGQGLAAFAQIFFAFEESWQQIEDGSHPLNKYDPDRAHEYDVCSNLAFLRPNGLVRSPRLRRDLEHIAKRTKKNVRQGAFEKKLAQQVRDTVNAKPHMLIAHAWVMYMAIFSGGRWIRQQFAGAGKEFWTGEPQTVPSEKNEKTEVQNLPGFSFLSFEGDQDGEDIKAEFKTRLAEAETMLTAEERQDVVQAAQELFEQCIGLVGELDRKVARQKVDLLALIALMLALLLVAMLGLYWFDNYGYLR